MEKRKLEVIESMLSMVWDMSFDDQNQVLAGFLDRLMMARSERIDEVRANLEAFEISRRDSEEILNGGFQGVWDNLVKSAEAKVNHGSAPIPLDGPFWDPSGPGPKPSGRRMI
jgi:hypothetical protein